MTDKSIEDGYGVSTGYTYGYYRQLSPTWLRFVAASRGLTIPDGEQFRYFELGFGQGVSLNVHAAANPGEYWGNDYNPEHVAFARQMAEASGANIQLLGASFEELAKRRDLPQFHVVVAHGIWSWISDSTRAAILKFLDEKLAPGGIFLVSYNALPGSISGLAMQRFLHAVSSSLAGSLSEYARFDIARDYLRQLRDVPDSHFEHYPNAKKRLNRVLDGNSPYLLHEYTVGSWRPELLLEVAAQLNQVGLEFCGSAYLSANDLDGTAEAKGGAGIILDETLNDFRIDRGFRSDMFIRSASSQVEQLGISDLGDQQIALTAVADEIDIIQDEVEDSECVEIMQSMFHKLEERNPSREKIAEILSTISVDVERKKAISSLVYALNSGVLHPLKMQYDAKSVQCCKKLNRLLSNGQFSDETREIRVSPIIGAAVKNRAEQSLIEAKTREPSEFLSELVKVHSNSRLTAVDLLKAAFLQNARVKLAIDLEILPD